MGESVQYYKPELKILYDVISSKWEVSVLIDGKTVHSDINCSESVYYVDDFSDIGGCLSDHGFGLGFFGSYHELKEAV